MKKNRSDNRNKRIPRCFEATFLCGESQVVYSFPDEFDGGGNSLVCGTVDNQFVLKVFQHKSGDRDKRIERFKAEKAALEDLNTKMKGGIPLYYPVVSTKGDGLDKDLCYVMKKYHKFNDLRELGERLTELKRSEICISIVKTLIEIHKSGYYHRDLKPENILFGDCYDPVIADFGLAISMKPHQRIDTDSIIGSNYYRPPEFENRSFYPRPSDIEDSNRWFEHADVYSLAKVIFAIMTFAVHPEPNQSYYLKFTGSGPNRIISKNGIVGDNFEPLFEMLYRATKPNNKDRIGMAELLEYLNDYHALINGKSAVRNDRYRKIRAYAEKFNSDGLFDERVFYGEGIRKVLCHFRFIVKDVRSELDNPLTGASIVCFGPLRTTSDYINVSYESDDLFDKPMKYVYCCKSQFLVLNWDNFTFELHCSEFSSLERERIKDEQAIPLHECVLVLDICCDQGL